MDIYFVDISLVPEKKNGIVHRKFSHKILGIILDKIYGIKSEIKIDNGRPYLENSDLFFSISHSENIIGIAFNRNSRVGFDAEYKKERDYKKILKYYWIDTPDITTDQFYQVWTTYEAEYKMGTKVEDKSVLSFKYKDYICSVVSKEISGVNIHILTLQELLDGKTGETYSLKESDVLPNTELRIKTNGVK